MEQIDRFGIKPVSLGATRHTEAETLWDLLGGIVGVCSSEKPGARLFDELWSNPASVVAQRNKYARLRVWHPASQVAMNPVAQQRGHAQRKRAPATAPQ